MRVLLLLFSLSVHDLAAEALPLQEVKRQAKVLEAHLPKIGQPVDDATFLRRAYLTIIGRIPTAEEASAFHQKTNSQRRSDLIETLVSSPGHASHMFNFWADLLRLQTGKDQHGLGWHLYIREFTRQDVPYDRFVREMLTATGHATRNKAVGYYLRDRNMLLDNVSNTAQVFLGQQIGCAQCHDHPFDDVSQLEYYQFAGFSSGLIYRSQLAQQKVQKTVKELLDSQKVFGKERRQEGRKMRRDLRSLFQRMNRDEVFHTGTLKNQLKLPHDYAYSDAKPGDRLEPAVYFGKQPLSHDRDGFAKWLTSSDNPYFTRVLVNRLWNEVYGQPLYPNLDDWSETPSPETERVLLRLEEVAKTAEFRIRDILRVLYHSRLFEARAVAESVPEGSLISGPVLRRMSGEQLHDSLLTLQKGNVDAHENEALTARWKAVSAHVSDLLGSSPEELLQRDEFIDANAGRLRELQQTARKNGQLARKFRTEGESEQARRHQRLAREARQERMELMKASRMAPTMQMMGRNVAKKARSLRISERATPLGAGSLLRRFGGSDRSIPCSSHSRPSVPQLLTLLNGHEIHQMTNDRTYYGSRMKGRSAGAKLEHVFLSLYARKPSVEEQNFCLPMLDQKGGELLLTRSILSSQSFLFIQ